MLGENNGKRLGCENEKTGKTRLGTSVKTWEEVISLDIGGEVKRVTSRNKTYRASAVIVCTGTQRRKLRVPGEAEFFGGE